MSETLNLGNGNWATKEDSLLAYNSENGNFKPLPFDFTRLSKATVVNKAGLIETVGGGEPRIDFSNDAKGALLLEPQRLQQIQYSEDFTEWTNDRVTVSENQVISPNGTLNADLIAENSENNIHRIYIGSISLTDNIDYTISVFAKKGSSNVIQLTATSTSAIGSGRANFDIENGVLGNVIGGNAIIENYGNGWYRCIYTFEALANATSAISVNLVNDDLTALRNTTYTGNINNNVYLYGAQLEQGSYATSYIPTQGSAVTRSADSNTTQVATNSVIGQTEGTIFYDINFNNIETSSQYIGVLSDGSSTNRIQFLNNISQDWQLFITASTISSNINLTTSTTGVGRYKIAIAYKSGDVVFYVNGVQKGASTETFTFSNLLHFDLGQRYDDNFFLDNSINNSKLYNTRLSNAELQALTS